MITRKVLLLLLFHLSKYDAFSSKDYGTGDQGSILFIMYNQCADDELKGNTNFNILVAP